MCPESICYELEERRGTTLEELSLRASNVVNATIFRVDFDTACGEYNPKRAVKGFKWFGLLLY